MSDQPTKYIPGVCNINPAEIRKRRNIGFTGLAFLVVLLVALYILRAPGLVWILAFMPAFLMATGFLQAKGKFCVGFAAAGMQHSGDEALKVTNDQAAIDKQRARRMNKQALGIAAAVAAIAVIIGSAINWPR